MDSRESEGRVSLSSIATGFYITSVEFNQKEGCVRFYRVCPANTAGTTFVPNGSLDPADVFDSLTPSAAPVHPFFFYEQP